MKKTSKVFYFISVFMLALAILTSGLTLTNNTAMAAGKVIKWKCQSHWPTASSYYKDSLLVIAEKIKTRTNGRMIIEPFSAGSLVPSKEIFNAVKRGMIEMGTASPAYMRDQVSIAGIAAGLPYAFKNVWECVYFHKFLGFEKMMRDATAKHGVYYSTDKI
ncbi:MAG: twin-arginine translocation pathway signal protein, partial [Deltaproteobacteria bacterium]|nr:twin-arginine translocation pathway signal protein [Deltaproteobacteria bacterium]